MRKKTFTWNIINSMHFNRHKFRLSVCYVERTVLEKGVTVAVLEICLSEKVLMEAECDLEQECLFLLRNSITVM